MAKPNQNDKDLASLKFGGASLLDIMYRAGVLPSVSTAYRMAKSFKPIISPVQTPIRICFEENINLDIQGINILSLKMDETYINPKLSYCLRDNQAYRTCYQNRNDVNLTLNHSRTARLSRN